MITCTKETRKTGEAFPQFVLGELQEQLYNTCLLFFSFPLLSLPGSSFPQDMKASRRGGHGPVLAELTIARPGSGVSGVLAIHIPVLFSDEVNYLFFIPLFIFFSPKQDPDACNADAFMNYLLKLSYQST